LPQKTAELVCVGQVLSSAHNIPSVFRTLLWGFTTTPLWIYPPGSRRASSPGLMLYWLGCPFMWILWLDLSRNKRFSRWHPSVWTQHVWLDLRPILK
jgi:hypothetical protein